MRRDLAVCAFLVVATLAVYGRLVHYDFVNFDDNNYVYENLRVREGLTWEGFAWAFTTFLEGNWHPLTWLSHMLDCELFGFEAAGRHHLVNVLLHILNSLLLYLVFRRMTGAVWRSAVVAALFALHPLHVESVAWVSERKDVLSTLFFLLTLWAYARYTARPSLPRYGAVFFFLALGLMAKPMLVTLPFVLLLLDDWPLGRFRATEVVGPGGIGEASAQRRYRRVGIAARLVLEKMPLFALIAASSAVTFVAQQRGGAMDLSSTVPLGSRIANGLVSYVAYIGKTLWPAGLAVFYPYRATLPISHWAGALVLLAGISLVALWAGRRLRYLTVGWLWYLGTLVPVIGVIQVGEQAMADRYTYVPLVGLFVMTVWGLADLGAHRRWGRVLLPAAAGAAVVGCMAVTWYQVGYWRNGIELFTRALEVTRDNALAHNSLGVALQARGRPDEAIVHYREALRIDPDRAEAHTNLGILLTERGQPEQGMAHYREALRIDPDLAQAHNQLGILLARQGRLDEAIRHYQEALRINPAFARVHSNLGSARMMQGNLEEAVRHFQEALRIHPGLAQAHANLGTALMARGQPDEGIAHYKEALRIKPDFAEAHINLGIALAQLGKQDLAVAHVEEALRINPGLGDVHSILGIPPPREGSGYEVLARLRDELQAHPGDAEARHKLGVALARSGKGEEAVEHLREAVILDPERSAYQASLALALAGQGNVPEAVAHYRQALRSGPSDPWPYNNLAWILATHPDPDLRDGAEAVGLAERACTLAPDRNPILLDTLAAAYAEAGRFTEAVATLEEAISVAASKGPQALVPELEARLEGYKGERPYREPAVPKDDDQG